VAIRGAQNAPRNPEVDLRVPTSKGRGERRREKEKKEEGEKGGKGEGKRRRKAGDKDASWLWRKGVDARSCLGPKSEPPSQVPGYVAGCSMRNFPLIVNIADRLKTTVDLSQTQ